MTNYEKRDENADDFDEKEFVDEAINNDGGKERTKEDLSALFKKLFAMVFSDNENESKIAWSKIKSLQEKYKLSGNDVLELAGVISSSDEGKAKYELAVRAADESQAQAGRHPY